MIKRTITFLSSYSAMAIYSLLYITAIAIATFIDSYQDTTSAKVLIYNNFWFILLQILMVINFILISFRRKLFSQQKYGVLLLHYGLAVILMGALITHLTGKEGLMMVQESETSHHMLSSDTYITLTAQKEGKTVDSLSRKVVYGELVSDDFSLTLCSDQKFPIYIDFQSYMSTQNESALNVKLRYGAKSETITLFGGKYQKTEPYIVNIDNLTISLSYGSILEDLPFSLTLNDFTLKRYPGSVSPSSYSSSCSIKYNGKCKDVNIYMNNIARIAGYRIYQTSYDKDEKGTILTVNSDYWGSRITYIGYFLLFLGLIGAILHRNSRFRTLTRRLSKISTIFLLFIVIFPQTSIASNENRLTNKELATQFSSILVQNPNGRIEPFGTYAEKIARKLYRSAKFKNLSAEQFLLGVATNPKQWSEIELIYIGSDELLRELNLGDKKHISYNSLFDKKTGGYRLAQNVENIYEKPIGERSKYDKELIKLDERVNILSSLFEGKMLNIFPVSGDQNGRFLSSGDDLTAVKTSADKMFITTALQKFVIATNKGDSNESRRVVNKIKDYQRDNYNATLLPSERKIEWELFYNRINIFKKSGIAYLVLSCILLILTLVSLMGGISKRKFKSLSIFLCSALIIAFCFHSFGILLRSYISQRAPWSNSYESMIYVAWSALFAGIIFMKRSKIAFAIAAIMGGIIIMISQLNLLDPEITPLVPVLKSNWLMYHVATITASYGFFGVGALIGVAVMLIYILTPKAKYSRQIEELTIINELALTIGLVLLTIGIFLGAIWANESWGRYWGWDPKESWALITMVLYAFVLHARFIPSMRGSYIFNILSIYSFFGVLMTFFGVNYFLSGLHSYGNIDSLSLTPFLISALTVMVITIVAERKS